MYWWIRDRVSLDQPPRVYQLSYQPDVHKKTEQVLEQQKKGAQYVARKNGNRQASASAGIGASFEKISKASRHKKKK